MRAVIQTLARVVGLTHPPTDNAVIFLSISAYRCALCERRGQRRGDGEDQRLY